MSVKSIFLAKPLYRITFVLNVIPDIATITIFGETYNLKKISDFTYYYESTFPNVGIINITKSGYESFSESVKFDNNKRIEVKLEENLRTITFDITPNDATIKYSINSGEEQTLVGNTLQAKDNDIIFYEISKTGFITESDSLMVSGDYTVFYILTPESATINITFEVEPKAEFESNGIISYKKGSSDWIVAESNVLTLPYGTAITFRLELEGYTTIEEKTEKTFEDITIKRTMELLPESCIVNFCISPRRKFDDNGIIKYKLNDETLDWTILDDIMLEVEYETILYYRLELEGYQTYEDMEIIVEDTDIDYEMEEL